MRTTAIIVAAGRSERLPGAVPKQFQPVAGLPLIAHTLRKFDLCPDVTEVLLVVAAEHVPYASDAVVERFQIEKVTGIVEGGQSRFESVYNGLRSVDRNTDIVIVHDGVRPLVSSALISQGVEACARDDAVVVALPADCTVKRVEGDYVLATLDRSKLYLAQTPQVFRYPLLIDAYTRAASDKRSYTDDAAVVEAAGYKVKILKGDENNIKITTSRDLDLMRYLLTVEQGEQDAGV
jgi:2-C-methyl-D-erythritol 4-phosphate cytidylyltransferase